MKKAINILLILIIGIYTANSCKKEEVNIFNNFVFATIINSGAVEVDGCGWLVCIDSVNYHPINLPDNFKQNDLAVKILYHEDSTMYFCGLGAMQIPSIYIEEIDHELMEMIFADENNMPSVGDQFFIDTAYIQGDVLEMWIGYSGGCEKHEFEMYVVTENPDLMLFHNANNDACEAFLSTRLYINLIPLRDPQKNSISFNLRQSPEQSSYYATLIYDY